MEKKTNEPQGAALLEASAARMAAGQPLADRVRELEGGDLDGRRGPLDARALDVRAVSTTPAVAAAWPETERPPAAEPDAAVATRGHAVPSRTLAVATAADPDPFAGLLEAARAGGLVTATARFVPPAPPTEPTAPASAPGALHPHERIELAHGALSAGAALAMRMPHAMGAADPDPRVRLVVPDGGGRDCEIVGPESTLRRVLRAAFALVDEGLADEEEPAAFSWRELAELRAQRERETMRADRAERERDEAKKEVDRLRGLFDAAGAGDHNVLALVDCWQREAHEAEEARAALLVEVRELREERDARGRQRDEAQRERDEAKEEARRAWGTREEELRAAGVRLARAWDERDELRRELDHVALQWDQAVRERDEAKRELEPLRHREEAALRELERLRGVFDPSAAVRVMVRNESDRYGGAPTLVGLAVAARTLPAGGEQGTREAREGADPCGSAACQPSGLVGDTEWAMKDKAHVGADEPKPAQAEGYAEPVAVAWPEPTAGAGVFQTAQGTSKATPEGSTCSPEQGERSGGRTPQANPGHRPAQAAPVWVPGSLLRRAYQVRAPALLAELGLAVLEVAASADDCALCSRQGPGVGEHAVSCPLFAVPGDTIEGARQVADRWIEVERDLLDAERRRRAWCEACGWAGESTGAACLRCGAALSRLGGAS